MVYVKFVVEEGRMWSVRERFPEPRIRSRWRPVGDAIVLVYARIELKENGSNLVDCNGD